MNIRNLILDIPILKHGVPVQEIDFWYSEFSSNVYNAKIIPIDYGIFPCKNRKVIVFKYENAKIVGACVWNNREIEKLNAYSLKIKFKDITSLPNEVTSLCLMQANEVENGAEDFKVWQKSNEYGTDFKSDHITITQFRVLLSQKNILKDGFISTITAGTQDRLPNSGFVAFDKMDNIYNVIKGIEFVQQQLTLF